MNVQKEHFHCVKKHTKTENNISLCKTQKAKKNYQKIKYRFLFPPELPNLKPNM